MELIHLGAATIGYMIGSIPFGLVLTRIAGLGDIREIGSGNIGATNVLRTGNRLLAFLTLILDAGKGAASASAITLIWGYDTGLIAGFFAVVGHNFPFWLNFRGGKGVATTLGVIFIASWHVGLATCTIWLLIAGIFRYSSLASLSALAISPIIAIYLASHSATYLAGALSCLAFIQHRENILRLTRGEESRIGQSKKAHDHNTDEEN